MSHQVPYDPWSGSMERVVFVPPFGDTGLTGTSYHLFRPGCGALPAVRFAR